MSINWVMLSIPPNEPFVKLPNERILYTSPSRTSLALSNPKPPAGEAPFTVSSSAGTAYITNQRLVYIPKTPQPQLQSFSAPILNLQNTCVRAPYFGANYWSALVKAVPGGGIPSSQPYVELKMVFSDGGAFDHQSIFEQIKERLSQALEASRASGASQAGQVDMSNVHLEQLPAYEPAGATAQASLATSSTTQDSVIADARAPSPAPNPDEPPPGYEEAQVAAFTIDLEARLRAEVNQTTNTPPNE